MENIISVSALDQVVVNVANRCVELAAENSTTGNWIIDQEDLQDLISVEDYLTFLPLIESELRSREEVLDLDTTDQRLDLIIGIAWVKNYTPLIDTEEEQALAREAGKAAVKPLMSMTQTISFLRARVHALQSALDMEDKPEEFVQCPCCGKVAWFSDYDSEYHCGCCSAHFDLREVLGNDHVSGKTRL
ncbi:MAG: hypothetical protein IJH11_08350 [Lachnospiraceae bacterium]|nr:hypothetical protein [Lachnospiraceae bacterium]